MPAATDMTPPQVADLLGCTAPTVRALIRQGALPAVATKKAKRTYHFVMRADVEAYIDRHGLFNERARRPHARSGDPQHQALVKEVRALRELVESRVSPSPDAQAEVIALREAMQLQRAAMAALLEADDDRSAGVRLLQQAMQSLENADSKRKQATQLLDDVIGSLTLPGTAAELTD